MHRLAQIICPLAAGAIVIGMLVGVRAYAPEPESVTELGAVLLALVLIASQMPVAVAPYVSDATRARRTMVAIGMLPTAAILILIAIDLLPRLVFPDYTDRRMVGVLAAAMCGYVLGFLSLRSRNAAASAAASPNDR